MEATTYKSYLANGFRFKVAPEGRRPDLAANSGVCVLGVSGEDADPANYYGVLREVLVLNYSGSEVVMFMCEWFDNQPSVGAWSNPKAGLMEINPTRRLRGVNEPFILASQATQVYYALSPGNRTRPNNLQGRRNWLAVFTGRARHAIHGLTPLTPENPTPNTMEDVYQDDTAPNIAYLQQPEDADQLPPLLVTGELLQVDDDDDEGPAQQPSSNQIFNTDDVTEHYSSDEYAELSE